MKKILKGAVVLLIATTLVFSTVAIADTNEEQIQISEAGIKSIKNVNSVTIVKPAFGPVIFSQPPSSPDSWHAHTSDFNLGWICVDDFWDITEPICDIHWWGLSLIWDDDWYACDPTGIQFEIVFYDAYYTPVCTYASVIPTPISTGQYYNGWELFYWEYDLDPCCDLDNGWVSIQSIYSPNSCAFLWMNSPTGNNNAQQNWGYINDNLAFELTGETCNPSIDVEKYAWDEKNQKWVEADTQDEAQDIKICKDTTFLIEITNNGDVDLTDIYIRDKMHDSLKYIRGEPEPDEWYYAEPFYYINWFIPGPLPPGGIIKIYVYAHVEGPECSYDYNYVLVEANGCGTIVTDEDYAWVHAHDRAREFNTPILNFLRSHPNLFPLLQKLIQGFGL
jgi:hypothetical protein